MKPFELNVSAVATATVTQQHTAIRAGSGSLSVFATPFMIALMEAATCNAVAPYLENDETTVGTKIDVAHTKASGLGTVVTATATIVATEGRKIVFDVLAVDDKGNSIGNGTIERFLVNGEKFMAKLG